MFACCYYDVLDTARQQQTDDKAENWGPVVPINYNKNETLKQHIAKLRSQKLIRFTMIVKHAQPPKQISPKFDLGEVDIDIHEMKDQKEIKKGKDVVTLSNDFSVKSPSLLHTLKAYLDLEPIKLQELEIKPIPVRNTSKDKLTVIEYSKFDSC